MTPLIFPDAVTSDPVILFSVVKVKALLPPVMAATVMSALLLLVELVSMVVALPKVTAPKTTASSDVAIVPFKRYRATNSMLLLSHRYKFECRHDVPRVKVPSLAKAHGIGNR